ncbi:hypothetical protein PM085_15620 [Halorubrum ezzemoulense]|uniref:Uncharacterized protein n=1 Tax=Halorubrum ezzemoulense TaxID=337243 RepID=A0ABT4Z6I5_HALEZ|nr:hypothetical protein [Halorubrum ezzemoulense]MDB2293685.1 hypothetical protein [Halorubrum ezzemoulense]
MNTKDVLGVVLAFGVFFSLAAGSGVGATIFGASPGDAETSRTLEDISDEASVDPDEGGGIDADVAGDNEPTTVGVALSGGAFLANLVGAVALLPVTLGRIGFPYWFAVPIGGAAQVIATVGIYQFISGRELL